MVASSAQGARSAMPPDPRQGQAASGGALRAALTQLRRHGEMPIDDQGDACVVNDAAQCH